MGPLTYKVFNLYYFIRCGTYNSHLQTNTSYMLSGLQQFGKYRKKETIGFSMTKFALYCKWWTKSSL
ncbi:hypothetical protein MTR_2g086060 [Medicago truncatula]|uniref:Uncharacterized protein n=1 Tax=Medicago truncatula TaxID=3880 RepID=G7IRD6_MEDTR|nr:hypothetical protein MTR_2g086060 [Medicago truncatula]